MRALRCNVRVFAPRAGCTSLQGSPGFLRERSGISAPVRSGRYQASSIILDHKALAASVAPVLYVQASIRHSDSPQVLARRTTPGAQSFSAIEPEATPETPTDGVQPWMNSYHVFDVVMVSAERAEGRRAPIDIICRRCYDWSLPGSAHLPLLLSLEIMQICPALDIQIVCQPCSMLMAYASRVLTIPIGIYWYFAGKIKTTQYNCPGGYL